MKKTLFSLVLVFVSHFVIAQVTTTNWLYQLDRFIPIYNQKKGQFSNKKIKLVNTKDKESEENNFGTHFFRHIKDGKIVIYKDIACTTPFEKSEMDAFYQKHKVTLVDTIIVFDPETFEEEFKIVSYKTNLLTSEDVGYRLQQAWKFNKKTQQLNATVKGLSVTNVKKSDLPMFFSVKVNDNKKSITEADLKNDDFILVQRITYNESFKGEKINKYFLSDKHLEENKVCSGHDELSFDKMQQMFESHIDTIITFDPETFEETINIVEGDKVIKQNIDDYTIIQDFYLDPLNMVIKSKIIAIAPLKALRYQNTEKIYAHVPIFWIVYDDAFFERVD